MAVMSRNVCEGGIRVHSFLDPILVFSSAAPYKNYPRIKSIVQIVYHLIIVFLLFSCT